MKKQYRWWGSGKTPARLRRCGEESAQDKILYLIVYKKTDLPESCFFLFSKSDSIFYTHPATFLYLKLRKPLSGQNWVIAEKQNLHLFHISGTHTPQKLILRLYHLHNSQGS